MLTYIFLFKKYGYLYITFKHYNIKQKKIALLHAQNTCDEFSILSQSHF